jgi:adenylate cyclase
MSAISGATALVLVLSGSARTSKHVSKEVERASSKGRPIIALHMDAVPLTAAFEYFLSESQWIDVGVGGVAAVSDNLVEAVRRHLKATAPAEPSAHTARQAASHAAGKLRWKWTIAAATALAAGTLIWLLADRFWISKHVADEKPVAAIASATIRAAPAIPEKSVAVLPFLDMSEHKDQEYFSDGLSEELIDMLTNVPDLRVPARTSSFYFKGKQATIADIAKALGVAHVLEGSVRKSGHTLRVTAQLIRVDNGYHVWSETYDRKLDDIFKIQDEIAADVVKALRVSLHSAGIARAAPTSNSEAYSLYLQALSLAKRDTSEDTLHAHGDLNQALGLDPKFALAWAALAELYSTDNVAWGKIFPPDESISTSTDISATEFGLGSDKVARAAHAAAARALTLAPNVAEVHSAMAQVLWFYDFDWSAADAELQKARALDPGSPRIAEQLAQLAITTGRLTEGVQLANFAANLDPLGTLDWDLGTANHRLGSLDQAVAAYLHLIELHPTLAGAHYRYGLALMSEHNPQGALEQHWATGMAYQISYVYAGRGDTERALSWLERAYRRHDSGLLSLINDPMLVNLQDAPRFKTIVRKLKLPEQRAH